MTCQKCKRDFGEPSVFPFISVVKLGHGLVVLCIDCWRSSTPDERVFYYRKLYEFWLEHSMTPTQTWNQLETLVRKESNMSWADITKNIKNFIKPLHSRTDGMHG